MIQITTRMLGKRCYFDVHDFCKRSPAVVVETDEVRFTFCQIHFDLIRRGDLAAPYPLPPRFETELPGFEPSPVLSPDLA